MKQGAALAIASVLLLGSPSVHADDALAAPPLTLTVAPEGSGGPWKLKIENTGDVPVRVAADPRLLVLEVSPPDGTELEATPKKNAKKVTGVTVTCRLPEDSRPATDDGSGLVVPGKRSWTVPIDPLFYCFGARERRALVSGAKVSARFGWQPPAKPTKAKTPAGPFVASPVGAAVGKLTTAKELISAPFVLTENVAFAVPAPAADAAPSPPGRPALRVSMPESRDIARGNEIETSITATNEGDQAALLLFRSETVRFTIAGPQGSQSCGGGLIVESPIRELYGSIGVKGRASLALLLDRVCPVDTFDDPGIYRVTATLDTSLASGRSIGLKTWDGESTAKSPMLLRVRLPRRPSPPKRPTLD